MDMHKNNPLGNDFSPQIHPSSVSAGFTIVFTRTEDRVIPGAEETHIYSLYSGNLESGTAIVDEYMVNGFGVTPGVPATYDELYPQFSRYGNYISFVSTDGITDEVCSASYIRGYGSPDSVSGIYQWTLSPSGTIYSGPLITAR